MIDDRPPRNKTSPTNKHRRYTIDRWPYTYTYLHTRIYYYISIHKDGKSERATEFIITRTTSSGDDASPTGGQSIHHDQSHEGNGHDLLWQMLWNIGTYLRACAYNIMSVDCVVCQSIQSVGGCSFHQIVIDCRVEIRFLTYRFYCLPSCCYRCMYDIRFIIFIR